MLYRHTITENAGNQLGIVPVFRIELLGKPLHSGLVATLVLKLEVIPFGAVSICALYYLSFLDAFRECYAFLIILQTGENP